MKRSSRWNHPPLRRRCRRLAVPKHLWCYSRSKYERDRSQSRCRRYQSPQWQRSCRRRKVKRYCRLNHPPLRRRCLRLAVPKHLWCYSRSKYERDRSKSRCRRYTRPNGNGRAVGGKGNATAAMITRRFAVDVSALLFPSTCGAIPGVNTNVTGVRAVAVVHAPQWQRSCRRRKGKRYAAISSAASPSMSAPCCSQALVVLFQE